MSQPESSDRASYRFGEPGYAKVDPNFDIVNLERAVLAFWDQKGAFEALREQNREGEVFCFRTGRSRRTTRWASTTPGAAASRTRSNASTR